MAHPPPRGPGRCYPLGGSTRTRSPCWEILEDDAARLNVSNEDSEEDEPQTPSKTPKCTVYLCRHWAW
eukprot:10545566-Alexandrium_andersonii.AAC.1